MREIIANDETNPIGCAAFGCLVILVLGFLVSSVMNVGRPKNTEGQVENTPTPVANQPAQPAKPKPQPKRAVSVPDPEPAPPESKLDPLCKRLVSNLAMLDDCELMQTGSTKGPTLFLAVDESVQVDGVAGDFAMQLHDELKAARARPGVLALESDSESWVLSVTDLQTCLSRQRSRRITCIEKAFDRIKN